MANKRRRGNRAGSLFRRKPSGPWLASWYDHDGRRQTRSTGTTDKAAAERILAKRVNDAALRREKVIDARAESIGKQAHRPIGEHLTDWRSALEAKGTSDRRVVQAFNRTERVVKACRFKTLADVASGPVRRFIRDMQDNDAAPRTINGHLQAIGQFIRWAAGEYRLAFDPLADLSGVKVIGQTRNRRPLDADELAWLLDVTGGAPAYRGMMGADRVMLYRVAVGTGFRASELRSLTRASFNLDGDPPTVTVRAAYSKRRRDDVQPIRPDLAALLAPWLAQTPADGPAFNMPDKTAAMLRADLRRARARWIKATRDRAERRERRKADFLAVTDGEGRVVDFHSLRATFITMIVKGGASVKVAQELARHCDPKLTMNVYTRLGVHDVTGALDALPGCDRPDRTVVLGATGTDDATADGAQQQAQQRERESLESGAAERGPHDATAESDDDINPIVLEENADRIVGSLHSATVAQLAEQRFCKPQTHSINNDSTTGCETPSGHDSSRRSSKPPIDSDLAELIDAWPDLPERVRAGIVAMVRAVQ